MLDCFVFHWLSRVDLEFFFLSWIMSSVLGNGLVFFFELVIPHHTKETTHCLDFINIYS